MDDVMGQLDGSADTLTAVRAEGPQMWHQLAEWRGRRSVTVLVAPTPLDWRFAALLDAPLVLVPGIDGDPPEVATAKAAAVVPAEHVGRDIAAVVAVVASGYLVLDASRRLDNPWGPPELSGREREILRSVALGETVRQTARSLGIATKTVENLQSRLYRKLGVRNRAAALAVAYDLGLVEVSERSG
jgi:DNA-binding CsgD family transcriptional regulator